MILFDFQIKTFKRENTETSRSSECCKEMEYLYRNGRSIFFLKEMEYFWTKLYFSYLTSLMYFQSLIAYSAYSHIWDFVVTKVCCQFLYIKSYLSRHMSHINLHNWNIIRTRKHWTSPLNKYQITISKTDQKKLWYSLILQ